MKNLTLKDFLSIGNPCLDCGKALIFRATTSYYKDGSVFTIAPTFIPENKSFLFELESFYESKLLISINPYSHKISLPNEDGFRKYLKNYCFSFFSACGANEITIQTKDVSFDLDKKIMLPINLSYEVIKIVAGKEMLTLFTDYSKKTSAITRCKISDAPNYNEPVDVPLLPLSKFKNKAHFIEKIKTYLAFS